MGTRKGWRRLWLRALARSYVCVAAAADDGDDDDDADDADDATYVHITESLGAKSAISVT